jgi:hypothetical protein
MRCSPLPGLRVVGWQHVSLIFLTSQVEVHDLVIQLFSPFLSVITVVHSSSGSYDFPLSTQIQGVVVVVVVVVVVTGSQHSLTGHLPSFIILSTFPSGQVSGQSHSNIGQLLSLLIPEHIKVQHSSHFGSGRGLQIVVLQPQSSSDSTSISHGRH